MKAQGSEPYIKIDPLQPAGDHWSHAKAIKGNVQAISDIRPYPDARYPGGYVLDYREPSGKAPVIDPGDEPPFLYGDGRGGPFIRLHKRA